MRRRIFIEGLGFASVWPMLAHAQHPAKVPTVGYLSGATRAAESQRGAMFVQRLRELGWIDGQTIAIQFRWAEGHTEQFAEIAGEFVRLKVDVIVATGTPLALAAKQATSVIPIVFVAVADPRWTNAENRTVTVDGVPYQVSWVRDSNDIDMRGIRSNFLVVMPEAMVERRQNTQAAMIVGTDLCDGKASVVAEMKEGDFYTTRIRCGQR